MGLFGDQLNNDAIPEAKLDPAVRSKLNASGGGPTLDVFTAVGGANEIFTLSGNPTSVNTIIFYFGFGALAYWATMGATPYFTLPAANQVQWADAIPPGPFTGGEPVAIMWW